MKGKTKKTESHIAELMNQASINQQYEEAAIYRDQLDAIRSFKERQSHVATDLRKGCDRIGARRQFGYCCNYSNS